MSFLPLWERSSCWTVCSNGLRVSENQKEIDMPFMNELDSLQEKKSTSVRYVIHKDVPNNQWNVYKKVGLYEEYVDYFTELSDAQNYCDQKNGITGS